MSKKYKPKATMRQQFNWWRIDRHLEKLKPGECAETLFNPSVHVDQYESGFSVTATRKQLFGRHSTFKVSATRSEDYGYIQYVRATHNVYDNDGELGYTERYEAIPGEVHEETLTASAVCRVLRAARRITTPQEHHVSGT